MTEVHLTCGETIHSGHCEWKSGENLWEFPSAWMEVTLEADTPMTVVQCMFVAANCEQAYNAGPRMWNTLPALLHSVDN